MIDIRKAKEVFDDYVKNYSPNNKKIKLKIDHIKRVADISKDMATKLKLPKEDIELAELIGLLHDIGRFEQVKQYNTFSDKDSINHGELGVKILFEDGLIRKFLPETTFDNIIKKAILNHNKSKIEDGLNERELIHAKIIRDSDKTDIFYVILHEDVKACYETDNMSKEIITPEIYREFVEEHSINYANRKNGADTLVCHFAYVFDYNFDYGLKVLNDKEYIDKLYNSFSFEDENTQKICDSVYQITKEYMDKKINNTLV